MSRTNSPCFYGGRKFAPTVMSSPSRNRILATSSCFRGERKFALTARHSRELAQSGIDRVYFVVVGSGFRQHDLENLAQLMATEPIRSVCFLEAHALMRLVNDSIATRDTFRLAEIDRMLFGNKIIDA